MYRVIGRFDPSASLEPLNSALRKAGFTPDEYIVNLSTEQIMVSIKGKDFARRDSALGLLKQSGALEVWAEERR